VTPGNLELVQVVASWVVTLPTVVAVIAGDEKRLSGRELERAWPPVSRDSAIFAMWNLGMPHLCVFVHFVRTRRTLRGTGAGLLWLSAIALLNLGAQWTASWAVETLGL
jgi:hypothetical protein